MLTLIRKVHSSKDATIKYIFKDDNGFILEFSYIDKNDGKDIICVPSQTMCEQACRFCHTTDYIGKINSRKIHSHDLIAGIRFIYHDLNLKGNGKVLLISFMGCGEPVINWRQVVATISSLSAPKDIKDYDIDSPLIRFAIATSLPRRHYFDFLCLMDAIYEQHYKVKMHFSLHYTNNIVRKKWMPNALEIMPSLTMMQLYKQLTGNAVEIHYALIDRLNDSEQDAIHLNNLIKDKGFNVKFLLYNEKDSLNIHPSRIEKYDMFKEHLEGIETEYYIPPGLDIGASCGQFLMDYYLNN